MARGRVEACSKVGRLRGVREVRPRSCLGHQIYAERVVNVRFRVDEAALVLPAASVILRCEAVTAGRQGRRRIAPRPAAIRGRRTKLRRPVEHRHRAVGLGGAVQGNDVGGRDRVAADHRAQSAPPYRP